MRRLKQAITAGLTVIAILCTALPSSATPRSIDPAAVDILRQMCSYLGGLKAFSLHTDNSVEDILDTGHRIDIDVSATVTISRPNGIHSERKGELIDQEFFYNGKTLTLYNPGQNVYASEPSPPTIEGTLDFARETLGLIVPVADLVYRNAFSLLMQDTTLAKIIGKSVIGGVICNHLLFSKPGVDFQVWVAEGKRPLPCKYVVTDTGTSMGLSVSTVMSKWDVSPDTDEGMFNFEPPQNAQKIDFMPL